MQSITQIPVEETWRDWTRSLFYRLGSDPTGSILDPCQRWPTQVGYIQRHTARVYIIPRDVHPFLQPACWHNIWDSVNSNASDNWSLRDKSLWPQAVRNAHSGKVPSKDCSMKESTNWSLGDNTTCHIWRCKPTRLGVPRDSSWSCFLAFWIPSTDEESEDELESELLGISCTSNASVGSSRDEISIGIWNWKNNHGSSLTSLRYLSRENLGSTKGACPPRPTGVDGRHPPMTFSLTICCIWSAEETSSLEYNLVDAWTARCFPWIRLISSGNWSCTVYDKRVDFNPCTV